MKKVAWVAAWLLEFFLIFCAATGCMEVDSRTKVVTEPTQSGYIYPRSTVEKYKTEYNNEAYSLLKVRRFVLDGHDYLWMNIDDYGNGSYLHSPDCKKCATKGSNSLFSDSPPSLEGSSFSLWD